MRWIKGLGAPCKSVLLTLCALLVSAMPARAVLTDRYLVGLKLRAFEAAWDAQPDDAKRRSAAAILEPLTFTFLSGNLSRAAQLLDLARFKLVEVPESNRWSQALAARVAKPLVDAKDRRVKGKLAWIYKPQGAVPGDATIHLVYNGQSLFAPCKVSELVEANRDFTVVLPEGAKPGAQTLSFEVRVGDKLLHTGKVPLWVVDDLDACLSKLDSMSGQVEKLPPSVGRSTWLLLHSRLKQAAQGKDLETEYPLGQWLTELPGAVEELRAGKVWPNPTSPGPLWLAIPIGSIDKVVRIEGAARDGKTPLTCVVALHGAGGSENLFCEGHGALAPKLAAQKGWLLVSPLNGPNDELIEKLSAWHPIDKNRVVTVGHSMGAANATAWGARKPEQLRAVAALGGGGRAGKGEVWQKLPYFVGIGDKDFALKSAKSLAEALRQAGNPSVTLKVYPGLEHLTVVQACLPDVFAFFEKELGK